MALMAAIQERNQSDPVSAKKMKRKTTSLSFTSYLGEIRSVVPTSVLSGGSAYDTA